MPPIKLWTWPVDSSPPACSLLVLGDKLGLEFEPQRLDYVRMENKSPEILKLNPMGTIPFIQDGDFVIAESHAIMKYLLEKYGSAEQKERFYPSELRERAMVDQALFFDTGVVFIQLKNVALPTVHEGLEELTPALKKKIDDAYSTVELYLQRHKYIALDRFTMADISVGTSMMPLDAIYAVDEKKYPRTVAWLQLLKQDPSFQKIAVPGAQLLEKILKDIWESRKK